MKNDTPRGPHEKPQKGDVRRQFLRLVAITAVAATGAVVVALAWLKATVPVLHLHMAIATALGVWFSVMLAGVLMALVFFSSASGMDGPAKDASKMSGEENHE